MKIVKLQRFSTHDGPGIRTVVFAKGCPLRCKWCHNPETQKSEAQIMFQKKLCVGCGACAAVCENNAHIFNESGIHCFIAEYCTACGKCSEACACSAIEKVGREINIEEILEQVLRDSAFFAAKGGITLSGGEPMAQPEQCIALLRAAKEKGITTAVETSGYFDEKYIEQLCESCDTLLWDFKDGNSERHKEYTRVYNQKIISNLLSADKYAKNIVLRCIIVKGVNNKPDHLNSISEIYRSLKNCSGVELIAYHAYAGCKAEQLGGCDNGNVDWIPTDDDIKIVSEYLTNSGVKLL